MSKMDNEDYVEQQSFNRVDSDDTLRQMEQAGQLEPNSHYYTPDTEGADDYVTLDTTQTISGQKKFDEALFSIGNNDYRLPLTTPYASTNEKRYLVAVPNTGSKYTGYNSNVFMQNGILNCTNPSTSSNTTETATTSWVRDSIDITGVSTDMVTLVKGLVNTSDYAKSAKYARWLCKINGVAATDTTSATGSYTIANIPLNVAFTCEAICNRLASATDYGYQLRFVASGTHIIYRTYVNQSSTTLTWYQDVITIGNQTIAGNKTFSGTVSANSLTGNAVYDRTSVNALTAATTWANNSKVPTLNTIAYWDGRYQTTNNVSNLKYAVTPGTTDNSNRIATTSWVRTFILNTLYPVGTIYISKNKSCAPASLGGTWNLINEGYALWTTTTNDQGGQTISAGLPNIKGTIHYVTDINISNKGTLIDSWSQNQSADSGQPGTSGNLTALRAGYGTFDANNVSSIYGNSTTVQPPAYKIYAYRRDT